MRLVVQRSLNASVTIHGTTVASIPKGLVVLIGIEEEDTLEDITWLCAKLLRMRIFSDANGLMNLDIAEINGEFLLISQFTLHASTKKGNRPSYIKAAKPEKALALYNMFVDALKKESSIPVKTGVFGANMQVQLVNDGPVTIFIDSKNKM